MQKSELRVKATEELQKSIASDLNQEDNNDKFAESVGDTTDENSENTEVTDAGTGGAGDDQEDSDTVS